jgi:integrase
MKKAVGGVLEPFLQRFSKSLNHIAEVHETACNTAFAGMLFLPLLKRIVKSNVPLIVPLLYLSTMPGEVNFYLKDPDATLSPIYLLFKYNGQKLKYYPGQSIKPGNWSKKKQRVKNNNQTTADGRHLLNDLLDNLVKECNSAYNAELKNGTPLPGTLKKHLDNFIDQQINRERIDKSKPTLFNLIDQFIAGEIKKKGGREKSSRTLQNYNAVKLHLQEFEKKKRYRIDFDSINLEFFNAYTTFLRKEFVQITRGKDPKKIVGLAHNTIAKDITFLKVFMNKGISLGYTTNLAFKHEDFSYSEEPTDAIYLKESEIEHLFKFDTGNDKLNGVKDMFVAGCWLGLRYSDLKNIRPLNIIEDEGERFIKIQTQKTGADVVIPCHPMVLKVMSRYNNNPTQLPKAISGQKFNEYIKEVCQKAELNEKGRLTTDPGKALCECVSSHTMRRSMASNFYLMGVAPEDLMPITGHTTRKSFDKYIKVSKLDKAKKLNTRIKQLWEKKQLKAV